MLWTARQGLTTPAASTSRPVRHHRGRSRQPPQARREGLCEIETSLFAFGSLARDRSRKYRRCRTVPRTGKFDPERAFKIGPVPAVNTRKRA
jgi:hypothetical protein